MTPRQLEEAIDANLVLQEAAMSIREGYEKLHYGSILRGQTENAQQYRELTHAVQDEIYDLQSINFDLVSKLRSAQ